MSKHVCVRVYGLAMGIRVHMCEEVCLCIQVN